MATSDKKISQLVETPTIDDNDLLTTVQGGINKKITGINSNNQFNERWLLQLGPSGFYEDFLPQILSIIFDDGTRTLTITPQASTFDFFSGGIKFIKTGTQQVVLPDSEGLFYIYYDNYGNLLSYLNPDLTWGINILRRNAIVAFVYWDAANKEAIYFTGKKELHGMNMSGMTHAYLHYSEGTKYIEGCQVSDIILGDGDSDRDAQFSVDSGKIKDEDILLSCIEVSYTVGLPIFYLNGSNADLRRQFNSGFSVITIGTGRLAWNQWTGSTWQLTEVGNNKYVNYFVFVYNDGSYCFCSFVGQSEYNSKKDAEEAATTEAYTIIKGNFPIQEAIASAVITFQTSDSYTNAVKGRIISSLDLTKSNINLALSLNLIHNTLAGLELAAPSDVFWGHVDDVLYEKFYNPDQIHTYHFGKHGDNTKSGLTKEEAVLDISTAESLAQAQTPSSTNRFVLICTDNSDYDAPSTLHAWIDIYAPHAKLEILETGIFNVEDNTNIVVNEISNRGNPTWKVVKLNDLISVWNVRYLNTKIEINAGTVYLNAKQMIAADESTEYIYVNTGKKLFAKINKIKGKVTVLNTGKLFLKVDDSSEITENFAVGAEIYLTYLDKKHKLITVVSGSYDIEPEDEGAKITNDGAITGITLNLPPADVKMANRLPISVYLAADQSVDIVAAGGNTIRVINDFDTKLTSNQAGNFVALTMVVIGQWTIAGIAGTWTLTT